MPKTIIYLHGFKSSSDSSKAKVFDSLIKKHARKTQVIIPDIKDDIRDSYEQIEEIIESASGEISFVGSSLGGYYSLYFAQKYNTKATLSWTSAIMLLTRSLADSVTKASSRIIPPSITCWCPISCKGDTEAISASIPPCKIVFNAFSLNKTILLFLESKYAVVPPA